MIGGCAPRELAGRMLREVVWMDVSKRAVLGDSRAARVT